MRVRPGTLLRLTTGGVYQLPTPTRVHTTDILFHYLLRAVLATALELLAVLGPALAIGAVSHLVAGVAARRAHALLGFRVYYYACGWLGTALHEASHALVALLFGHRITSVKWFDADARDGSLGHVRHGYDPRSAYQRVGNLFIGVAPLIVGTAIVYVAGRCLLEPGVLAHLGTIGVAGDGPVTRAGLAALGARVAGAAWRLVAALASWRNLASWRFWAFAYVAFTVGTSIRLSGADLEGAGRGLGALATVLLLVNLATLWAGEGVTRAALAAARWCAPYYGAMLLVVVVIAVVVAVALALALGVRGVWGAAARLAGAAGAER